MLVQRVVKAMIDKLTVDKNLAKLRGCLVMCPFVIKLRDQNLCPALIRAIRLCGPTASPTDTKSSSVSISQIAGGPEILVVMFAHYG